MSRSKNQYQGMSLQRVHRSELDDSKRRDLARHEARLGEDLKTVERARHVMMKSHESDKLLFIKSGAPSINKVNKSTPGSLTAKSTTQSSGGYSRFVPDTKIKRSSFADQGDVDGPPATGTNGPLRSERVRPAEQTAEPAEASYYDTTSVYDRFFEANTGIAAPKRGSKTITDEGAIKPSAHPTRTNEALSHMTSTFHTTNGVHSNKDTVIAEMINHPSQSKQGVDDTDSDNEPRDAITDREYRQETKRPSIWETLSVPKHMSTVKSKRSQVEREFSRPSPSAAIRNGKAAGGQRLLLQNGSEKTSTRQTGIQKGRNPSDKRIRNDT